MRLQPRRLPKRFNRAVSPATRRLVERRMRTKRDYSWQRWKRIISRMERKFASMKRTLILFGVLFGVGLVVLIVGLLLFSPILSIREIRVTRSDPRIDVEQVQRSLADLFGQHLFFLSPTDVDHRLHAAMPDVESTEISKDYPRTLQVRLSMRPIIARLVIVDPRADAATAAPQAGTGITLQDYLTDDGTYVTYEPNQVKTATGVTQLNIVDWGVRPEPWKPLLEPAFLEAMQGAENLLRSEFGLPVESRTAYLRAREFHLKTRQYELWFDLRSSLQDSLDRYRMFLRTVPAGSAKQYVDLRLKDKVIYK